jgi:hypothetical protein
MKSGLSERANAEAKLADAQTDLVREIVHELLEETKPLKQERRAELRHPFFRPVHVIVEEQGICRNYSCFSRDISPAGIGLLHNMPLQRGEVVLTFPRQSGGEFQLQAKVQWCQPCGEGWYLSGAQFLGTVADG